MHKPNVKELGELSHSACMLYEWLAYREFVAEFYGRATHVVVIVEEEVSTDSDGPAYKVTGIKVFDGNERVQPSLSLIAVQNESGIPVLNNEDAEEFLEDYVSDLPVPHTTGKVVAEDKMMIDLTRIPKGAEMAQRIWLED